jgi:hypothetical protein
MQESVKLALVEDNGIVGKSSVAYHGRSASIVGSRFGKRADRARFWPAILISMIVVPMIVVLGFYAAIPAKAAGPAPIDLGGASNFVILSKAGISTTGATHIWGNIGVSPIDSTAITGFDLNWVTGSPYATSALVTGNVYAPDYADPTPATLGTAVLNMETAYTNAAGLPADDTELYAGDLTGQTLYPGVHKWGTNVLVSAAGTTLQGNASDVWVFQISGTLTLASGANVYLSPNAQAANIFWQVAGDVTIGTTAVMKGTILCATQIAMQTTSSLEGRALAQTAVTLDATTVYAPGTVIPEFSQVLIPLVGMMFVVAIAAKVRNQRK